VRRKSISPVGSLSEVCPGSNVTFTIGTPLFTPICVSVARRDDVVIPNGTGIPSLDTGGKNVFLNAKRNAAMDIAKIHRTMTMRRVWSDIDSMGIYIYYIT
jgi:hypothetical protein